jgi:hypothetical protein
MRILLVVFLAFAFVVGGCQTPQQKKEKLKQAELKKKAKTDLREEATDVDFQAFLGRLRKAVAKRDAETIKSMMTDDFGGRHFVGAIRQERRLHGRAAAICRSIAQLRRLPDRDHAY